MVVYSPLAYRHRACNVIIKCNYLYNELSNLQLFHDSAVITRKFKLHSEDNIALALAIDGYSVHAHTCSTTPFIVNICFCAVGFFTTASY